MTYDVVLPDPGARVRDRVRELQNIENELATSFDFALVPSGISVSNWQSLADAYGAVLPAPPDGIKRIQVVKQINYPEPQPDPATNVTNPLTIDSLKLPIPEGYEPTSVSAAVAVDCWNAQAGWVTVFGGFERISIISDANGNIDDNKINFDLAFLPITSGPMEMDFLFLGQVLHAGQFLVSCDAAPTEAAMAAWRQKCWGILYSAAYTDFVQRRNQMQNRYSALAQRVAADDSLTLRRREREEIMRLVLSWLFPGFDDSGSILTNLPDPSNLDLASWQQVMEYGEYIKFIQTAVDWDNVVVFLYPYFWDTLFNQDEKLFLTHPDALHRDFLRAGAARVVLSIVPGFEEQVLSLLEQGQLGLLPANNRFQKVIDDVTAANQDYQKTESGNPNGDDPGLPGMLIGSWIEYAPTGALDIDVTMQSVTVVN